MAMPSPRLPRRRPFLSALTLLLCAAASPAQAASGPLTLGFEGYGSGLPLLEASLRLERQEGRYAAQVSARASRLIDLLTGWSYEAEAEGMLAENGPRPDRFRGERRLRRKHRVMTLSYGPDGSVEVTAEPEQSPEDAQAVPPEHRPGSLDPMSAILGILASGEEGCAGTFPVFDGRRRYDLRAEPAERIILPPGRSDIYSGPALRCRVTMHPVAGFESDRDEGDFFEYGVDREVTAWIAPAGPEGEMLPVRVEADLPWSNFILHLVSISSPPP